jgi:acetyl esterase/lipase
MPFRQLRLFAAFGSLALAAAALAFQPAKPAPTEPPKAEPPKQPAQPAGIPVPTGVKAIRDIEYAKPNGSGDTAQPLKLDLYLPEDAKKPLPLVILIHGGAWESGSKDRCPGMGFAQDGYVVASINYRLSDVATFPAQIFDCKAAVRFLRAHATEYHIDPARVGVWGGSAGGHLAALLGTSGGVKELEGDLGNADQSSKVQAVCDWYGPADLFALGNKPGEPRDPVVKLLGGQPIKMKDKCISACPITHVTADDPPFLIMHGDKDNVVSPHQSELLVEALNKAGVPCTYTVVKGASHGFRAQAQVDQVHKFFDKELKKPSMGEPKPDDAKTPAAPKDAPPGKP